MLSLVVFKSRAVKVLSKHPVICWGDFTSEILGKTYGCVSEHIAPTQDK